VIHYAVSQAALEVAIDPAIHEGAITVEPIHNPVIDATDLCVDVVNDATDLCIDVVDDANDDLMRIGIWGIGLGGTGTEA
jgi:hypothetical protein